jgi:hypothetical protein
MTCDGTNEWWSESDIVVKRPIFKLKTTIHHSHNYRCESADWLHIHRWIILGCTNFQKIYRAWMRASRLFGKCCHKKRVSAKCVRIGWWASVGFFDGHSGCVRKVLSDRSVQNGVEQAERSESRVRSIWSLILRISERLLPVMMEFQTAAYISRDPYGIVCYVCLRQSI